MFIKKKGCERSHFFNLITRIPVISFLFIVASTTWAQPTDQQQLDIQQRQDELLRQRNLERQALNPTPDVRLEVKDTSAPLDIIPTDETPCFIINAIELVGIEDTEAHLEHVRAFQWALDGVLYPETKGSESEPQSPILGKCYGVQGINAIMKKVQNAIIDRGYITTRVIIGPQQLASGVLRLTVVPGLISSIDSERSHTLLPLEEGELLNLRDIEQALEHIKRLASVEVDIQIIPASSETAGPGDSDLLILWEQGRPWRLFVSADNSGSKSTGSYQGNVSLVVDDLVGINDILTVSVGNELGNAEPSGGSSDSVYISYSFPVKKSLLAFTASDSQYEQIIEGFFRDSEYSGRTRNYNATLSHLLYRDNRNKLDTSISAWATRSKNLIDGFEVINQRRKIDGYTLSLAYRAYVASAVINASTSYRKIYDAEDVALRLQTEHNNPRPTLIKSNMDISIPFTVADQSFRYIGRWQHQMNRNTVPSQEFISLGNRYNVRMDNEGSSLSAPRGWFVQNDIEFYRYAPNAIIYLGYDYGRVGPESLGLGRNSLSSAVVGVKGNINNSLGYEVSLATPIDTPDRFIKESNVLQLSLNWQY